MKGLSGFILPLVALALFGALSTEGKAAVHKDTVKGTHDAGHPDDAEMPSQSDPEGEQGMRRMRTPLGAKHNPGKTVAP